MHAADSSDTYFETLILRVLKSNKSETQIVILLFGFECRIWVLYMGRIWFNFIFLLEIMWHTLLQNWPLCPLSQKCSTYHFTTLDLKWAEKHLMMLNKLRDRQTKNHALAQNSLIFNGKVFFSELILRSNSWVTWPNTNWFKTDQ